MEKVVYEYALLRYVPDIERGEFVNVGLMMMCKRFRWMMVRSAVAEERIRGVFARPELGRLRTQLEAFSREDVPGRGLPVEERYRWLAAVKSAVIQSSPSHPGILLVEDKNDAGIKLDEKFEELFSRLVL